MAPTYPPRKGGGRVLLAIVAIAIIVVLILSVMSLGLDVAGISGSQSKIRASCTNNAIIDGDYRIELYSFADSTTTVVDEGSIGAGQTIEVVIPIDPGSYQITFTVFLTGYAGVDYAHMGRYGIENLNVEKGESYSVELAN